jgi:predicted transcriptional regulator
MSNIGHVEMLNTCSHPDNSTARRKIPPKVARRILATPGASLQIARLGGFSRSYVSMVLHQRRPASDRLLDAIVDYFEKSAREVAFEIAADQVRNWAKRMRARGGPWS